MLLSPVRLTRRSAFGFSSSYTSNAIAVWRTTSPAWKRLFISSTYFVMASLRLRRATGAWFFRSWTLVLIVSIAAMEESRIPVKSVFGGKRKSALTFEEDEPSQSIIRVGGLI